MSCVARVKRETKQELSEQLKEVQSKDGALSADGSSPALTSLRIRETLKELAAGKDLTPIADTTSFYNQLRRELGEEVDIVTGEGSKPSRQFLVDAKLHKTEDGLQAELVLVDPSDVTKTYRMIFTPESDIALDTRTTKAGSIEGIQTVLKRTIKKQISEYRRQTESAPDLLAPRGSEVHNTLVKMMEADTYLDSRQDRGPESLMGYEKITDYKHGEVASMRQILNKLHVLGGEKADKGLLSYYNKLIDKLHPRFFNQMELYMKKSGAEARGQVQLEDGKILVTYTDKPLNGMHQSEAEVYMHELNHTMLAWALRSNDPKAVRIKTQLQELMKTAQAGMKWQDMLLVPEEQASERQIERAKEMFAYPFSSKNSIDEFVAYAMTNPQMINKLSEIQVSDKSKQKRSLFRKMMDLVTSLMDLVLGKADFRTDDISVFERVSELAFELAELNNYHQAKLERMNPLGQMMEVVNTADEALADKFQSVVKKLKAKNPKIKIPKQDDGVFANAKFFLEFGAKAIINPTYRDALGIWASAMWLKPTGSVREILGGLFDKTTQFRNAERVKLLSDQLDTVRNTTIAESSKLIMEKFKTPLTVEEEGAITTALLETNLGALRYNRSGRKKYADKDVRRLLEDKDFRTEKIGRLKHLINQELKTDKERSQWTIQQAVGLGYYMATGEGSITQIPNSDGIARGFGLDVRYERNARLSALIGEIASIYALNYVPNKDKAKVASLIKNEADGINMITDMYEEYKYTSKNTAFKGQEAHIIEGHVYEMFDQTIDVLVAPVSKRKEMEADGYELKFELTAQHGDAQKEKMAMYSTSSWGKAERLRGAVGVGRKHSRGTTLSELKRMEDPLIASTLFNRDYSRVMANSIKQTDAMRKGNYSVENSKMGMMPVFDANGKITDFRYVMSKAQKRELMNQDLRVTQVLPRSVGRIEHQVRSEDLNKRILEDIKAEMKAGWVKGEFGEGDHALVEYSLIGPEATDPYLRELFFMLPENFREFIMNREDKTMAVRADLVDIYFGRPELQLSNAPLVRLLPKEFKHVINTVEGVWKEAIKISKGNILLKMPQVIYANLQSNLIYLISTGSLNPKKLFSDHREAINDVNQYIDNFKKISRLDREIARDTSSLNRVQNRKQLENIIAKKEHEREMLKRMLEQSEVKELFDAGMYQSTLIEAADTSFEDTNRIAKYLDNKINKLPRSLKVATDWAYLNQNTSWYKATQELLQRSDMYARAVYNKRTKEDHHKMVEGKKNLPEWWVDMQDKDYPKRKVLTYAEKEKFFEMAKVVRLEQTLDAFINYSLPNGPVEEYLNKLGVLQFTKYLKRSQKVISDSFMKHPLKTATVVGLAMGVFDMDTVQDSSVLKRVFFGHSEIFGVVPAYGLGYHFDNLLYPPLISDNMLGRFF